MELTRFRILLAILLMFFVSRVVFAKSVVETEYEMLLPRPFQQSLIEQNWQVLQNEVFKLSWPIPDQVYDTPDVKVLLHGILLNLQTMLEKPAVAPSGDAIILQSKDLQADLHLDNVSVDQYIEREVGGVIVRVHIQARCDGVNLHMKSGEGTFKMTLSPIFEGSTLKTHLDDVTLSWTPNAWDLSVMQCTGAQGFEDIIREEVKKVLSDPARIEQQKASLMARIQEYLDTKTIDFSQPQTLVTARPDIQASMTIQDFVGSKDAARVRGVLRVDFLKSKSGNNISLKLSSDTMNVPNSHNAFLKIPEEFVKDVFTEAYYPGSWVERVPSNKLPGFTSLMKSRFKQFFVWTELMNYPKKSIFIFDIYSDKEISIKGQNLKYNVSTELKSTMFAPKPGGYVNFMYFTVPMKSQVKMGIQNGQISAQFLNVSLSLHGQWDHDYLCNYMPTKHFSSDKIAETATQSLEGYKLNYALPAIPVTGKTSLQVQKVQMYPKSTDLLIYLK